jgi:hypothetical protein
MSELYPLWSRRGLELILAAALLWLAVPTGQLLAQTTQSTWQEPKTETEEKLLSRMLERRTFTSAEAAAINQNGDLDQFGNPRIDVRDLVLYYKQFPKPAYAYFDKATNTVPTWSGGATNVLVRFSKPYTGTLNYQITGTALVGRHFALSPGQSSTNGIVVGSVSVNGASVNIPILPIDRQQFTGPATLTIAITGFRDVANQAARYALTQQTTSNSEGVVLGTRVRQLSDLSVWQVSNLAQLGNASGWTQVSTTSYDYGSASTHLLTIVESDLGLYSGMIRFDDGANLDPQPVRVAFRSNGTAVFDVSQAPLLGPTNFVLPVTLPAGGKPVFGGATTTKRDMPSQALSRTVSWTLRLSEPAAPVATVANDTARYALTGLGLGDLVVQQTPAPATLWRVSDTSRLASPTGWAAMDGAAWNLLSSLNLSNVTANPAGVTLKGVLRLDPLQ